VADKKIIIELIIKYFNGKYNFNLSIYIYIKMAVQMFVCLSVGMWRANGNPNPCTNHDGILHAYPKKVLVLV